MFTGQEPEIDDRALLDPSNLPNESQGHQIQNQEEHVSLFNWKILKPVWFFIFNCSAVYFLEYVIQTGFASVALPAASYKKYYYSLFNLLLLT